MYFTDIARASLKSLKNTPLILKLQEAGTVRSRNFLEQRFKKRLCLVELTPSESMGT